MLVYHVATVREWSAALATGSYERSTRDRTLAEVGFVHGAFGEQVAGVLDRFYADAGEELVLLTIDTDRTGTPCRIEDGFPHLYGPLPCVAVIDTAPLPPSYLTYEIG